MHPAVRDACRRLTLRNATQRNSFCVRQEDPMSTGVWPHFEDWLLQRWAEMGQGQA
jgi:hypothetical protein